jgi:ABC-2 type transport system permease protein
MIGGCFWPIEIMPEFLQKAANFVPQKWTIDAIVRLASGESIMDVWMNIVILGLFALILLSFGSAILKPSESQVN